MITLGVFEWDLRKNRANFEKHGITFEEAAEIFQLPVFVVPDDRKNYGEERFIGFGWIAPTIAVVVVFVKREEVIRIISARRANSKERKRYYDHLKKEA